MVGGDFMIDKVNGMWWFEGAEGEKYSGSLTINSQGGELVLIDLPDESDDLLVDECNVHGITSEGRFVLYNGFQIGGSTIQKQCRIRSFRFNWVFKGWIPDHFRINDFSLDGFTLDWPELQEWFSVGGYKAENENKGNGFSIVYKQPDPISFSLDNDVAVSFDFFTKSIPMGNVRGDIGGFSETVFVNLEGVNLSPDKCFKYVDALRMFFSICSGRLNEPEKIKLHKHYYEGVDRRICTLEVMGKSQFMRNGGVFFHPMLAPASYSLLGSKFPEMISKWLNSFKEYEAVALNYMLSTYGPRKVVESSFIYMVQAAEAFHRKNEDFRFIERKEFEEVLLPKLEKVIDDHGFNKETKNILKKKISYINEKSLKARLVAMFRSVGSVSPLDGFDIRNISQSIVDARNYLTHYSDSPSDAPSLDAIAVYTFYVRFLFEAYFLVSLGVDTEVMETRYRSNRDLDNFLHNVERLNLFNGVSGFFG